jgi:colicin import membrane protein
VSKVSVSLRRHQTRVVLQMFLWLKTHVFKSPLVYSAGIHLLMLLLVMTGFRFDAEEKAGGSVPKKIVQAVVISEKILDQEIEKIRKAENRQEAKKKQRLRQLEKETAALRKQRESAQKLLAELASDNERLKNEEKKAGEKKLLADKKAEAAQKKAKEAALKASEAEKMRRVAEAKYQETERARKQAASFAEKEAESAEIARYTIAIHGRVRRFFNVLPNFEGLTCVLDIRLLPDGNVATVSVQKSSGNEVFDRHAENAVRKSAPLPVPSEPDIFKEFRNITFRFDPKF